MGRVYATDYVLVPWEDRFIEEHNVIKEFQRRSLEVISVFPEAPGVQQLVLAEFFEDDAFMEPPHMVLRGYVFLFWAEFLPNIPDYQAVPLQQWIDENDVYSIIERQVISHRNREYLLQKRSKAHASLSDSKDAEPSEEVPF
jgi:hypothetical protein